MAADASFVTAAASFIKHAALSVTDGKSTNDTSVLEIFFSFFLYDIARAKQDSLYWV